MFVNEPTQLENKILRAGVSSFGFSGTLSHVVLESSSFEPYSYENPFLNRVECKLAQEEHLKFTISKQSENVWIQEWTEDLRDYMMGHRIGKVPVIAGTCYIEMIIPCIEDKFGVQNTGFEFKKRSIYGTMLLI